MDAKRISQETIGSSGNDVSASDSGLKENANSAGLPSGQQASSVSSGTPNRKRGKCMSRRSGQSGNVVRKGNMWHGRYYVDIGDRRKRLSVPLCPANQMTKAEAKRKLRALIEESGVNTEEHLLQSVRMVRTFAEEANWWKENKLSLRKPSVQEMWGGYVDRYFVPHFGKLPLDAIDERRVQEFISVLNKTYYNKSNGKKKNLEAVTIHTMIKVLKAILGRKVWRDWNLSLPTIPDKEQRFFTPAEIHQIIGAARGQWRVLFATLATMGQRGGEAFGLRVSDLDLDAHKIYTRRSIYKGQEVSVKTRKGYRVTHIDPVLAEMLKQHLAGRTSGLVFQTTHGTPYSTNNVRRKLHSILQELKLPKGGLHAFRHGRVSFLRANRVPDDLIMEWIGHSNLRVTSNYTHFTEEFRQQMASEFGIVRAEMVPIRPIGPNSTENGKRTSAA